MSLKFSGKINKIHIINIIIIINKNLHNMHIYESFKFDVNKKIIKNINN